MNVTFRIEGGEDIEKRFVKLAGEKGIKGVSGHRSVGGQFQFSIFAQELESPNKENIVPQASVRRSTTLSPSRMSRF